MGIEIVGQENVPRIVCPHCRGVNPIDLSEFKDDVTQIMRDKCPKCGNEIFVAVLILAHKNHFALLQNVKAVANLLEGPGRLLV